MAFYCTTSIIMVVVNSIFYNEKQILVLQVDWYVKGLLHPKIKVLSLITYPHVVPNP